MTQTPLVIIAGPTGSGKSDLAMRCAEALNGEVVAADSVQVFRGLDIGSAKVSPAEREAVPHHMLDIADPDEPFDAARYVDRASAVIHDIRGRSRLPVVCGGTTLYLTALLHGLVDAPSADPAFRDSLQSISTADLHTRLAAVDPQSAARLHSNDRVRIIRALEIQQSQERKPSEVRDLHAFRELRYPAVIVVLCWGREQLYQRINARSAHMVAAGVVEETRHLRQQFPNATRLLSTLGYAQACDFLDGKIPADQLVAEIAMYTRRYAKRQMTFWRNEPAKRSWAVEPRSADVNPTQEKASRKTSNRSVKDFSMLSLDRSALFARIKAEISRGLEGVSVWYVDAAQVLE